MAQEALGSHHRERFAPRAQSLTAEAVEKLRGGGWVDDLDVVLGGEPEKSFEARAGMLRPGALEAVRQQQDEAAELLPFVFAAGDKLIDDRLGHVPEIAELRFPDDEAARAIQ